MTFKKIMLTMVAITLMFGMGIAKADEGDVLPEKQRACYNQPDQVQRMELIAPKDLDPGVNYDSHYLNDEDDGKLSNMAYITPNTVIFKLFSGISTRDFINLHDDLRKLEDYTDFRDITMMINSPGGSAFDGLAIAGLVKKYQRKGWTIRAEAYSMVASAAVPIYAVCRPRTLNSETTLMVHLPAMWKWPGRETSADIESQNKMMSVLNARYTNLLVENSDKSEAEWKKMMEKTTWFSPEDAEDYGMVEEIN